MNYAKGLKKLTTLTGWRQFLKILGRKERIVFFVFLFLGTISLISLCSAFYIENTEIAPASGGVYSEGMLGSPRFINPVYAAVRDTDRDLTELVYSGLMKYSGDEENKIVPDLAKEYTISEDGKFYEFYLKDNLFWQDGKPLTVEDVLFTIKTIQNASYKSPIRATWLGITVEKVSENGLRFELKNASSVFLENCTLKILPKHVWQDISVQNFPLSIYNLKPVGSGPYKIKDIKQDNEGNIKSVELAVNSKYYGSLPNIPKIIFYFFEKEDDLISAFNASSIKGFSLASPTDYQKIKKSGFAEYHISLPRYFSLFFNQGKAKILSDSQVRLALTQGTNKEEILNTVLLDQGEIVHSPILPEIYGFEQPSTVYEFDREKAVQLLETAGFTVKENGIGEENKSSSSPFADAWVREKIVEKTPSFQFKSTLRTGSQGGEVTELQKCLAKDPEIYPEGEISGYFGAKTKTAVIKFQEKYASEILAPYGLTSGTGEVKTSTMAKLNALCAAPTKETFSLSFTLITVDQPLMIDVASLIKKQWRELGVNVEIKTYDVSLLEQDIIKPRNYEILLFGEVLGAFPDPFPFWHSSQAKDPGLNLAGYENKECDKLLEGARQTQDLEIIKTSLEKFQDLLVKDVAAVFLYRPDYIYIVSPEIKGLDIKMIVDPSKRFSEVENWFIKTKRAWR